MATATALVKCFISDFYTWTNKYGQYDIGGMLYVYSPSRANIYTGARYNFYKYLTEYINEYGSENLLEVTDIQVTNAFKSDHQYDIDGTGYDCWFITCEWTYKESDKMDIASFVTKEEFKVIKNTDGRFEIVECYEV